MDRQYTLNSHDAVVGVVQAAARSARPIPLLFPNEGAGLNMGRSTILVVDDEPNIVEVVSAYLEREHFDVVTASDGEAALQKFKEHDPDLVVLDVMLPRLDGLEVCRRLR